MAFSQPACGVEQLHSSKHMTNEPHQVRYHFCQLDVRKPRKSRIRCARTDQFHEPSEVVKLHLALDVRSRGAAPGRANHRGIERDGIKSYRNVRPPILRALGRKNEPRRFLGVVGAAIVFAERVLALAARPLVAVVAAGAFAVALLVVRPPLFATSAFPPASDFLSC